MDQDVDEVDSVVAVEQPLCPEGGLGGAVVVSCAVDKGPSLSPVVLEVGPSRQPVAGQQLCTGGVEEPQITCICRLQVRRVRVGGCHLGASHRRASLGTLSPLSLSRPVPPPAPQADGNDQHFNDAHGILPNLATQQPFNSRCGGPETGAVS